MGGACVLICGDLGSLVSKHVERGVRRWEPSKRMDGAMLRHTDHLSADFSEEVSMTRWMNPTDLAVVGRVVSWARM